MPSKQVTLDELIQRIDEINGSSYEHKVLHKALVYYIYNLKKEPIYGWTLKSIDTERDFENGRADLYIKWRSAEKMIKEIIEVSSGKSLRVSKKTNNYKDYANYIAFAIPVKSMSKTKLYPGKKFWLINMHDGDYTKAEIKVINDDVRGLLNSLECILKIKPKR